MGQRDKLYVIMIFLFLISASLGFARDYIIYSIAQDLPMGEPGEKIKKNFYMNLGQEQGVSNGTVLDVYRQISRLDPYKSKKRHSYNVKIGEIKVLHSESQISIGVMNQISDSDDSPLFDIKNIMIGDKVNVNIGK